MIWDVLKGWLGGILGYLVVAIGTLGAVLVALAKAKQAGKDEVVAEAAKKEVEDAHVAAKVEQEIATAKPDARRERLREWNRD